ncbi:MAG: NAD(P)/FAD-dependent oxidoreductase [Candidatus Aenigmatarchaeota archaeon]
MYDTIIVGSGIAGISSAIYAARKDMDFKLLSSNFAGQINMVGEVKNYPGFSKVGWKELKNRLEEQMKENKIEWEKERVREIKPILDHFVVETRDRTYRTRTVVLATGARPRRLKVPGEAKLTNRGVSYCAICDAPDYEGKDVAVIGGGNSAVEATDFLCNHANKIYIINKNERFKCHEALGDSLENESIEVIKEARVKEIRGEESVRGLIYEKDGRKERIDVEGVFPAIGTEPNTKFLRGLVEMNEQGNIVVDKDCRTSQPGIFAAGDCTDSPDQLAVAAGQGATALIKAAEAIRNERIRKMDYDLVSAICSL